MDLYYGRDRQYANAMSDIHANSISKNADRFAAIHLTDSYTRHEYLKKVNDVIRKYYDIRINPRSDVREVENAKKNLQFLAYITKEQLLAVFYGEYSKFLELEIKKENGIVQYIMKGFTVAGGITQVAAGLPAIAAGGVTFGASFTIGVMLVAHGSNNIYEGLSYIIDRKDTTGLMRDIYRSSATSMGYDGSYGDLAYATVDIGLSLHAMFGKVRNPTTNLYSTSKNFMGMKYNVIESADDISMFTALSKNYTRGILKMSKMSLTIEMVNDAMSIKTILDGLNK